MPGHGEKVARDELKNVDQIRKDRAKKANLKELQVPLQRDLDSFMTLRISLLSMLYTCM
jgi:hypothetical protein